MSHVVDAMKLRDEFDVNDLSVRFVPSSDIGDEDEISVGRVSIYRQES